MAIVCIIDEVVDVIGENDCGAQCVCWGAEGVGALSASQLVVIVGITDFCLTIS